jgi:hypothetical protein
MAVKLLVMAVCFAVMAVQFAGMAAKPKATTGSFPVALSLYTPPPMPILYFAGIAINVSSVPLP